MLDRIGKHTRSSDVVAQYRELGGECDACVSDRDRIAGTHRDVKRSSVDRERGQNVVVCLVTRRNREQLAHLAKWIGAAQCERPLERSETGGTTELVASPVPDLGRDRAAGVASGKRRERVVAARCIGEHERARGFDAGNARERGRTTSDRIELRRELAFALRVRIAVTVGTARRQRARRHHDRHRAATHESDLITHQRADTIPIAPLTLR